MGRAPGAEYQFATKGRMMNAKVQTQSLNKIIAELEITEEELDYWSNYKIEGLDGYYADFSAEGSCPAHLAASFKFSEQIGV